MKIYVLTRTSGRPNYFRENVESVKMQTYPNIEHIVCADDDESFEYASKLVKNVIQVERNPKREEYGWMHSPYNLYCNKLMDQIKEPGWIMFLDDDDILADRDAIRDMVRQIENEDDMLIWRVKMPWGILPSRSFGHGVMLTDITSNSFLFHSKHVWAAQWDEVKEGDYRVAQKLSRLLNVKWIDKVLCRVNNKPEAHKSSAGVGLGMREDK
jgi:cellulose synthase/poly-beta-1,6-N-acetylglucosamine synthase-like glycosyltransferase